MITLTALLLGAALQTPATSAPVDLGPTVDPAAPTAPELPTREPLAPRSERHDLRDPFVDRPEPSAVAAPPSATLLDPFDVRPTVARPSAPGLLQSPFAPRSERVVVERPSPIPPSDLRDPFA